MNIEINLQSQVPIYSQIRDQVRHLINTGELQPGSQLPTVRQLAADLRVNFNTVARAYRQLDEDGIISTQLGRGTFILEPHSEEETEQLRQQDMLRLTHHYLTEAHRLGFSPEEVQALFASKLAQWLQDGEPPSEED